MSALQQNIEFTDKLVLNNRQSSFSFRIAPLSYFNSKKNRIKYILKGYDEDWIDAGSDRIAKYHAIPPGTYTFSAIASNEDGIWNNKETSINITITKPFWQKGWAIILFIVAMTMSGYVIWNRFRVLLPGVVSDQVRINHPIIQPSDVILDPAEKQFFQKAMKIVEENISDPDFGVNEMCDKMLISRSQLYRKIQAIGGLSVTEFIKEVRLKRAAQLLKQKSLSISEIAYSVGFNDPKYFSRCFKQQFGVSPVHFTSENERSLPPE
jgi:AraC-like DNA-binding protein